MWDWWEDDPFETYFYPFKRMLRRIRELEKNIWSGDIPTEGSYVYGYSISIGPDGIPKIREFGNVPKRGNVMKRVPFIDVNEYDNEVVLTAEMPGLTKEDIDVEIDDRTVRIHGKHKDREYEGEVELPQDVEDKPKKITYNNGILDITFKKKKKQKKKFKVE